MGFLGIGGGAPSGPNYGTAQGYMSTLQQLGVGQQTLAGTTGAQYGSDQGQLNAANNAYSQYLQSNPATQSFNAGQVANAEKGASEGAVRAGANLDMNLAARGISPNSSMGVGGLAAIQEGLAANDANTQSQIGQNNIAQHAQNLNTLSQLWNGQASTQFGQNQAATGAATGINQGLTNDATQQANDAYQAALASYNANQAGTNALLGGLGDAAGAGKMKFGAVTL